MHKGLSGRSILIATAMLGSAVVLPISANAQTASDTALQTDLSPLREVEALIRGKDEAIADLTTKLGEKENLVVEMNRKVSSLEEQNTSQADQLTAQAETIGTLREDLRVKDGLIGKLTIKLGALNEDVLTATDEMQSLKRKVADTEAEAIKFQETALQQGDTLETLQAKVSESGAALDNVRKTLGDREAMIEALKGELAAAEQTLSGAKEGVEASRIKIAGLETGVSLMQGNIAKLESQNETATAALESLEAQRFTLIILLLGAVGFAAASYWRRKMRAD